MNIVEQNINKLSQLWEKYHDRTQAFNDLTIDGDYLVYQDKRVNISNFSIEYLFIYGVLNDNNIMELNSSDIFRLVRLYVLSNQDTVVDEKNNDSKNNQEQLEVLKEKSPLLKRINIAYRYENNIPIEYINIVSDSGYDYLFLNDRHFKISDLYELINSNNNLTADDIISIMTQKLPQVPLKIAGRIIDDSQTNEAYLDKIKPIDEQYKDDKTISVLGNEEHDIVIVSDKTNPNNHRAVTFSINDLGNIEAQGYQNEEKLKTDTTVSQEIYLIPLTNFYDLINSNIEYNEEQRISVNNYYEYFSDLLTYQDYLTEDLNQVLINHKIYINNLITYQENGNPLTNNQNEAVKVFLEAQNRSNNLSSGVNKANVQRLTLKYKNGNGNILDDQEDLEQAGFAATIQVIIFVLAFATILTAVTLFILK